ncbi:hypothetical protein NLG97_g4611 [Lecanicillium saksenae]|uniref:Uncharacterized protein n=1 Tax=Lecanicillium saksenae TaxID=468837 RepID=A0ACC1QUZ7_9HYPO|nr:hypothetical protein NLG97_g4611 [Lecanicillium saksenae]
MNSDQAFVYSALPGSYWPNIICSNLDDSRASMGDCESSRPVPIGRQVLGFVPLLTARPLAVNEYRIARVAEVLGDFRNLQHCIASANINAPCQADYFTSAWTLLRQCATDGQFILDCSADISFPVAQNEHEQKKLELLQSVLSSYRPLWPAIVPEANKSCLGFSVLLDAYARRHEAQKIYLRQMAAQRCILARKRILDLTGGPSPSNELHLHSCDVQLEQEVQQITDEFVYLDLLQNDQGQGRWTAEDPGLYDILNWLHTRS